jgi:hypothetical protein
MKIGEGRALLGIGLLYLVAQAPLWGYLTDDTYIHLVYAHNLLMGKGWVFNLGEPSYGSTSPLWVLLLAPFASGEAAGLLAARGLALLAGLAAIPVFHNLARKAIRRPSLRIMATLAFATELWFIRWSGSGMESSLAVLVLLLFFDRLAAAPYRSAGVLGVGLLAGLCGLVRPEFYMLVALLLGLALMSPRWRPRLGMLLLGIAIPLLPWLLFSQFELGGAFPSTAAAKSRGWQGMAHLALQAWRLLKVPLASQATLLAMAGAGALACLLGGRCRRPLFTGQAGQPGRFRFWALLASLWGLGLPAVFLLRDVQVISRYLLPVTPLLPLAAFYFFDYWNERRPRLLRLAPLLIMLHLAPNIGLYFGQVLPYSRRFSEDMELSLGAIADHLRTRVPHGSRVAAPDIGLLGLRSGCDIVDLGGLIHPEIGELWHEIGYDSMLVNLGFLALREADYLVDRHPEPRRLAGVTPEGRVLLPVISRQVRGLGLRKPEPLSYTLYRIGPAPEN